MKTPDFWQEDSLVSRSLMPLSFLYRVGNWVDRKRHPPQPAALPILSVGNLTAGGAGKTPTALALVSMVRALGHSPHFLTRGYKATSHHQAHRVTADDAWQQVGDEALLLAQCAPTWIGRDRLASAQAAAHAGATLAICDDALQHYRLKKTLSLLVIDGPYGLGNGRLLPAGPLREPLVAAQQRCDAAIVIGEDTQQLGAELACPVFHASLMPAMSSEFLQQHRWIAFAGIGRPEKFFATLRALNAPLVTTHAFPDHHPYRESELTALRTQAANAGARLITTEKDAIKLPPHFRAEVTVLPVTLTFAAPDAFHVFLREHLPPPPLANQT